jgi:hypothetical protein
MNEVVTMSDATLKALRESIAHWERMQAKWDCGEEPYGDDCALCRRFYEYDAPDGDTCTGCPVMVRTGEHGCEGSPWYAARVAWSNLKNYGENPKGERLQHWQAMAQKQIEFLRSLLPEASAPILAAQTKKANSDTNALDTSPPA